VNQDTEPETIRRTKTMKTTISKKLFAGGALAVALAAGGLAHASTNILSGNVCTPFYQPELVDGQGVGHASNGVENLAANRQQRLVMCPILRDNTSSTGGLTKLVVNTSVASGFSGTVSCTGLVLTKFGSVKTSFGRSAAASTGQNSITFTELNKSDNGSGAFDLACWLPYATLVNSLEYQEP
jgi:hypothetical protein